MRDIKVFIVAALIGLGIAFGFLGVGVWAGLWLWVPAAMVAGAMFGATVGFLLIHL